MYRNKHKGLILIALFYCFFTFAQNRVGKVNYEVKITLSSVINNKSSTEKALAFSNEISKASESINLELIFNENESVFRNIKSVRPDNIPLVFYNIAKRLSCKGNYYTNLADKSLIQEISTGGKTYLVELSKSKEEVIWNLTKESKKIGDFICYKAISEKKIRDNSHTIIAWYAPNISVPYGPLEFGNLPGLILELHYGETIKYSAIKVITGHIEKIKFPTRGIKISKEKYDKMGMRSLSDFKNNLKD